ncbi:uncharacterized protein DDB_G0283357 [Eurytemora carolleeae]|uniref:uncharacterized protein DDB_G0283357 n=1 Tax=Eurytemora carolleeae TaxID=1294199 RepID=UPI000C77376E|nr:uncharacterized protein DDB_G0283357 [Eurytemora carolleeae]|eukprot:XP_023330448.1 uncharacterized protein DDB_G0283357-like [Eurytemora affinis]
MQLLSAVVLLLVCGSGYVSGDGKYWWMNSGAFNNGGAGNNIQNNNNHKAHNNQQGGTNLQPGNNYQNSGNNYQQPGNSFQQNNPGNNFQGNQDNFSPCPQDLSCLPQNECWTPPEGAILPRVASFQDCGVNEVCCTPSQPEKSEDLILPDTVNPSSNSINPESELPDLITTECPAGMLCVSGNYCDNNTEVTTSPLQLSLADQDLRKKLIPCMNQITRQLEVCCNQVESLDYPTSTDTTAVLLADGSESADLNESSDLSESADSELETSESVSSANLVLPGSVLPATQGLVNSPNQGSCPVVNNIPPVEQCAGRASNCWSVGQTDVDCIDNALCCFDGCSNVCQGQGVRPGLPVPQVNARGQSTPSNNNNDIASGNGFNGQNAASNNNGNRPGNNVQPNNRVKSNQGDSNRNPGISNSGIQGNNGGSGYSSPNNVQKAASSNNVNRPVSNRQPNNGVNNNQGSNRQPNNGVNNNQGSNRQPNNGVNNNQGSNRQPNNGVNNNQGSNRQPNNGANSNQGSSFNNLGNSSGGRKSYGGSGHKGQTNSNSNQAPGVNTNLGVGASSNSNGYGGNSGGCQPNGGGKSGGCQNNAGLNGGCQNGDGCSNGYRGNSGSISPVQPPNPRPVQPQQQQQQQPRPVQQQQAQPSQQQPFVQQQQQQPRQPVQQQPRPVQQQQQPRQPVQQQPRPVQQQSQQNFVPADQKPFTQCPSAMKCVPRINCNFEGVMVNEVFNLSPELEMLRVPLIPCVNQQAGNVVDVCCRDPNYQDPWPDMNNNNNFQGNQGNPGNQGNQGNQVFLGNQGNNAVKNKKKNTGYGK